MRRPAGCVLAVVVVSRVPGRPDLDSDQIIELVAAVGSSGEAKPAPGLDLLDCVPPALASCRHVPLRQNAKIAAAFSSDGSGMVNGRDWC